MFPQNFRVLGLKIFHVSLNFPKSKETWSEYAPNILKFYTTQVQIVILTSAKNQLILTIFSLRPPPSSQGQKGTLNIPDQL
jgi:hypothetical protein